MWRYGRGRPRMVSIADMDYDIIGMEYDIIVHIIVNIIYDIIGMILIMILTIYMISLSMIS